MNWTPDPRLRLRIENRWNSLTKPPGSLGRLEELVTRYCLVRGVESVAPAAKGLYIFCGDHGVVEEGVSAWPQEVTRQMVANFLGGGAAISVLCRQLGIQAVVVDAGVKGPAVEGALDCKIAEGTRNFAREPAMTRAQAERSIEAGRRLAREAAGRFELIGAGEMGIGNSTAAAALLAAFAGMDPAETAGRGAGVDDRGLERKIAAVRAALALHRPDPADPIGVLAAVGGFEIGAIAGLVLGAAEARLPVALDGFISCSAALVARALDPAAMEAVFFSHRSAESAHGRMLAFLGARPYLDLEMRLGEGTGAALLMGLLECALALYRGMATFPEAQVSESGPGSLPGSLQ